MRTRSTARREAEPEKPDDDTEMVQPLQPPPPDPNKRSPAKRQRKSKWDASTVLTSARSPLAKCDLRAILQHPLAWEILSPEERSYILSRFPDNTHVLGAGTPDARPDLGSLLNDNNFRHDCTRYAESIESGCHDEQWLWDAWEAHERRGLGEFDGFLEREFEEQWGVSLEEGETDSGANAGGAGGEENDGLKTETG